MMTKTTHPLQQLQPQQQRHLLAPLRLQLVDGNLVRAHQVIGLRLMTPGTIHRVGRAGIAMIGSATRRLQVEIDETIGSGAAATAQRTLAAGVGMTVRRIHALTVPPSLLTKVVVVGALQSKMLHHRQATVGGKAL